MLLLLKAGENASPRHAGCLVCARKAERWLGHCHKDILGRKWQVLKGCSLMGKCTNRQVKVRGRWAGRGRGHECGSVTGGWLPAPCSASPGCALGQVPPHVPVTHPLLQGHPGTRALTPRAEEPLRASRKPGPPLPMQLVAQRRDVPATTPHPPAAAALLPGKDGDPPSSPSPRCAVQQPLPSPAAHMARHGTARHISPCLPTATLEPWGQRPPAPAQPR